ncbi:competence protein ComK [Staphylococcus pseudintermedius]
MSMKQYIDQLAYQFQRDVRTQQKIASETLKVHQMIPIFLSKSLILCPLQSQRAAIQYYINVTHVIAASSHQQNTRIHFNNNLSLIVPMPFKSIRSKMERRLFTHSTNVTLIHFIKFIQQQSFGEKCVDTFHQINRPNH